LLPNERASKITDWWNKYLVSAEIVSVCRVPLHLPVA
jgi:hypothetical protein